MILGWWVGGKSELASEAGHEGTAVFKPGDLPTTGVGGSEDDLREKEGWGTGQLAENQLTRVRSTCETFDASMTADRDPTNHTDHDAHPFAYVINPLLSRHLVRAGCSCKYSYEVRKCTSNNTLLGYHANAAQVGRVRETETLRFWRTTFVNPADVNSLVTVEHAKIPCFSHQLSY